MREPKFVPGERAMINSKEYPQCTGDYVTVISVNWNGAWDVFEYATIPASPVYGRLWSEYALRKLPPEMPATFDASIWVPNKETVK